MKVRDSTRSVGSMQQMSRSQNQIGGRKLIAHHREMSHEIMSRALELEEELVGKNDVGLELDGEAESELRQFQEMAGGLNQMPDFNFVPIVDPRTFNLDHTMKACYEKIHQADEGWRDLMAHSNNNNAYIK